MATERTAGCLCGKIAMKLSGNPTIKNVCHCLNCQKSSGSPFRPHGFFMADQVTVNDPESALKLYTDGQCDSGTVLHRWFCSNCGSCLKIQDPSRPPSVVVPLGIIDGDKKDLKPAVEFYTKSQVGWAPNVDGTSHFDTMPPSWAS